MTKLRAVAVGLGFSAWAMLQKYQMFFSELDAVKSGAQHANQLFFIYYVLVCLAAGFFLASFYPFLERVVVWACTFLYNKTGAHLNAYLRSSPKSLLKCENDGVLLSTEKASSK